MAAVVIAEARYSTAVHLCLLSVRLVPVCVIGALLMRIPGTRVQLYILMLICLAMFYQQNSCHKTRPPESTGSGYYIPDTL